MASYKILGERHPNKGIRPRLRPNLLPSDLYIPKCYVIPFKPQTPKGREETSLPQNPTLIAKGLMQEPRESPPSYYCSPYSSKANTKQLKISILDKVSKPTITTEMI